MSPTMPAPTAPQTRPPHESRGHRLWFAESAPTTSCSSPASRIGTSFHLYYDLCVVLPQDALGGGSTSWSTCRCPLRALMRLSATRAPSPAVMITWTLTPAAAPAAHTS